MKTTANHCRGISAIFKCRLSSGSLHTAKQKTGNEEAANIGQMRRRDEALRCFGLIQTEGVRDYVG